jgi:hypothetical protein
MLRRPSGLRVGLWGRRLAFLVAVCASSFSAALAAAPAVPHDPATAACVAGVHTEAYSEASNACWMVYSNAMAANDYASAAAAVRLGCERDRRTDFCMFATRWGVTADSIREAKTSAERYKIRRAAEDAESFVTTVEIEDVELQMQRTALARALRNKNPQAGGSSRVIRNTRGAPRGHARN